MKQLLPSLILAFSVCTGCRTGTVRPERSEAPEIAAATAQPPPESVAGQLDIGRTFDVSKAMGTAPPSPESVAGQLDIGRTFDVSKDMGTAPPSPQSVTGSSDMAGTRTSDLANALNPMNDVPLTPTQHTIDFGDWVRAEE